MKAKKKICKEKEQHFGISEMVQSSRTEIYIQAIAVTNRESVVRKSQKRRYTIQLNSHNCEGCRSQVPSVHHYVS
jgi:hypothetical protein